MKKLIIMSIVGIVVVGCIAGCSTSTGVSQKTVPPEKQQQAAAQIDELAAYVVNNRDLIVEQVQVAQPNTRNWDTLTKLFDNLRGGSKLVGYLDPPYDKQEEMISNLNQMAIHFEVYRANPIERAKEFARGMKSLQAFEKQYKQ